MKAKTVQREDGLQKKFNTAHDTGAQEFGGLWLRANEVAIDGINMANGNYSDLKTKTMVSIVVLRVLILARHTYTGRKKRGDKVPMTDREKRIAGFAYQSGFCGEQLIVLQKRLEQLHERGLFDKEIPHDELIKTLLDVK